MSGAALTFQRCAQFIRSTKRTNPRGLTMKPIFLIVISCSAIWSRVDAEVVRYTNFSLWQNAIGRDFSAIDFTGWPQFTFITDQYANLGITFVDGDDYAFLNQAFGDGAGLVSNISLPLGTEMMFTQPTYAIGFDLIGTLQVTLYWHNEVVYSSDLFSDAVSTFGGLVSTAPFDSVRIVRPDESSIVVDNLYFGPPIPAPGALGLIVLAAMMPRRKRNC